MSAKFGKHAEIVKFAENSKVATFAKTNINATIALMAWVLCLPSFLRMRKWPRFLR